MSNPKPNNPVPNFYLASAADFKKIPGSPIAYWLCKNEYNAFQNQPIYNFSTVCIGMKTGDNELFVRAWQEVSNSKIGYYIDSLDKANQSSFTWFPYLKGGNYRKWHGNYELVLNWTKNGENIKNHINKNGVSDARIRPSNFDCYFKCGINWSFITSGLFGIRIHDKGFFFDVAGSSLFPKGSARNDMILHLAGYLNTKIVRRFLDALNPTLNMQIENIKCLPLLLVNIQKDSIKEHVSRLKYISKNDWDSYETSWDFATIPLLHPTHHQPTIQATYEKIRTHWQAMTHAMQRLEEENNRIFIDAYGLQDELTPDVPLSEITLTCNPHYRYNGNKTEEELETLLLTDTMKELISYSMGCMMGRYRLDRPGLIYAHSGNKDFEEIYHRRGGPVCPPGIDLPKSGRHTGLPLPGMRLCGEFLPDDDGIIPIMDQEWFADDAANRFIEFMKVAWPSETLNENLKFIAASLNPKGNDAPVDAIRRYFSNGFFKDHLKTYKKRPIYWLLSSGKQNAFECLVYLHRYNESTLARMRSAYVTPLQGNIRARIEFLENEKQAVESAAEKRKIQKDIDLLIKKQAELVKFDEELRHYADMKISLDLDDGVKVNYGKFGNLLAEVKTVTGEN